MQEIGIESTMVEAIRRGLKTIEGRLGKPRFLKMAEGDILSIREDVWEQGEITGSYPGAIEIRITQILYFETFKEMFEAVNYEAAVPTAKSVSQAVAAYREFYSKEDEGKYGVVALFFEPII